LIFPVDQIRKDFPILNQLVYGNPLVYFDNAATTQKPVEVIDAVRNYYLTINSNIHRGVHFLSQEATSAFEETRSMVRDFINAPSSREVIFTKGATESINLVAGSFGRKFIKPGDEVIITAMEHHANLVPWQLICAEKNARLQVIPINDQGELIMDAFVGLINDRTRLVALTHVSNVLGTVNPVREMISLAHQHGIPVLVDGAQAVPHQRVDVQDLDCDFYCFSAHKMYGPMGVGILYGKEKMLEELPPYQSGGEMINSVTFEKTVFNELPYKFEAGTPNVADICGFASTLRYLERVGWDAIEAYESELYSYALNTLSAIPEIKFIGTGDHRLGVISFLVGKIHPYDAGTIIDRLGIAVRTGHHCAQPIMDRYGIPGTLRASFAFYNTKEEIDRLKAAVEQVVEMFD
jgi:cysteine desulfurase/selenocysteine lyase